MKKPSSVSITVGLATGLILAASTYYFLKNPTGFPVLIFEAVFLFIIIYFLIRYISGRYYNKQISYRKALGFGVIATSIIALIVGLTNAVFIQEVVDDKEFRKALLDTYLHQNYQQGLRGDELNKKTLLNVDNHLNPVFQFFSNFFGYFIVGLLFSLLSASIVRKAPKPIEFKE